jgi:hypothetical protein
MNDMISVQPKGSQFKDELHRHCIAQRGIVMCLDHNAFSLK